MVGTGHLTFEEGEFTQSMTTKGAYVCGVESDASEARDSQVGGSTQNLVADFLIIVASLSQ